MHGRQTNHSQSAGAQTEAAWRTPRLSLLAVPVARSSRSRDWCWNPVGDKGQADRDGSLALVYSRHTTVSRGEGSLWAPELWINQLVVDLPFCRTLC